MIRKIVLRGVFIVLLLIFSIGSYAGYTYFIKPGHVHYHAGFLVFKDGKKVDFSDIKYMNIKPCIEGEKEKENEQLEKAHLHDLIGTVVHVHRKNAKWRDLFENLNYELDKDKTKAYKNGKEVINILNKYIESYESVVFVQGKDSQRNEFLKMAITVDDIKKAENKSENCGS